VPPFSRWLFFVVVLVIVVSACPSAPTVLTCALSSGHQTVSALSPWGGWGSPARPSNFKVAAGIGGARKNGGTPHSFYDDPTTGAGGGYKRGTPPAKVFFLIFAPLDPPTHPPHATSQVCITHRTSSPLALSFSSQNLSRRLYWPPEEMNSWHYHMGSSSESESEGSGRAAVMVATRYVESSTRKLETLLGAIRRIV
jgi:hypothetical protein